MNRKFYLDLAARGLRMPIGTDLVMHEESEPEKVRNEGAALGRVIERAARRWGTPLAVPLMDLRLEKIDLLALAGIPGAEAEAYHFASPLDEAALASIVRRAGPCRFARAALPATKRSPSFRHRPDLLPVGMAIGPFSLTTRLMADPIYCGRHGRIGGRSMTTPTRCGCFGNACAWLRPPSSVPCAARSGSGAKAIMICEPAACTAFISPRQIKAGSNLFERLVMEPNLRLKAALDEAGCDLIFHDCGELIDSMVEAFAHRLHPVILSLGSSRKLWKDARLVPADVVLFGNLPSKSFYSDGAMPVEEVVRRTEELAANMKACHHPCIVGSECDVLFVPGAQDAIRKKVDAMISAAPIG